jgi:hypothetical protein
LFSHFYFEASPPWYKSDYGELLNLFCSVISHVDPARVKVVPPVDVSPRNLDPAGVHFDKDVQQLVDTQLLSSFLDRVIVKPDEYHIINIIGYRLILSFIFDNLV